MEYNNATKLTKFDNFVLRIPKKQPFDINELKIDET